LRRDGLDGLRIRADEKDYAPPTVNPLFVIDGSDYTDVRFSLGARVTFYDIGGFGSELRNDVIVGSSYGAASEYYHPLNWFSHFFMAPRAFANSQPFDVYLNNDRIATYREHNAGELSILAWLRIASPSFVSDTRPGFFLCRAASQSGTSAQRQRNAKDSRACAMRSITPTTLLCLAKAISSNRASSSTTRTPAPRNIFHWPRSGLESSSA